MTDARQELIARLDKEIAFWTEVLDDQDIHPNYAMLLLRDCRAALSADASATPVAWMYEPHNNTIPGFRRFYYEQVYYIPERDTETPLYSCPRIPQQDEPSTPVARQEEPIVFMYQFKDRTEFKTNRWHKHSDPSVLKETFLYAAPAAVAREPQTERQECCRAGRAWSGGESMKCEDCPLDLTKPRDAALPYHPGRDGSMAGHARVGDTAPAAAEKGELQEAIEWGQMILRAFDVAVADQPDLKIDDSSHHLRALIAVAQASQPADKRDAERYQSLANKVAKDLAVVAFMDFRDKAEVDAYIDESLATALSARHRDTEEK